MVGETFGDQVQAHLRASGHSQKDLADALGLNHKVLSRKLRGSSNAYMTQIEVGKLIKTLASWRAITTRREAISLLELAQFTQSSLTSEEWQSFPLNLLKEESAALSPLQRVTRQSARTQELHNVPAPVTRLIGREWELARLMQLLRQDDVRLITLIGPGGSGKTRLAQQVAVEVLTDFADGVWFVPLSGISDAPTIATSIIQVLGLVPPLQMTPVQSLSHFLRAKQLLLLLDNFERAIETAPMVSELLAAAPGLKILVTSQAILHLYGEHAFSVSPLALPDLDGLEPTSELAEYPAIQLFVERTQAIMHDFVFTDENAHCIAQICVRLDGLPLALELAAAQIKLLPPAQLLERLGESLLSTLRRGARNLPARQQTLRNTIEWSCHLLSPDEQRWFLRLGIFTGGWQLEAVEAMPTTLTPVTMSDPVCLPLDILEQLVDKSLVVRASTPNGLPYFTMLESLREYALEQLAEHGELEAMRDWHASYYLSVAEAAEIELRGKQQLNWFRKLNMEQENLRAALRWSLQRARSPADTHMLRYDASEREACDLSATILSLRLAAALSSYWEWQGNIPEGRHWLEAALALPSGEPERAMLVARARALSTLAWLLHLQSERQRAIPLIKEGIVLWQQLGDQEGLLAANIHLGWFFHAQGELELARQLFEQCLQQFSPTSDSWLRADLFYNMGQMAGFAFDFTRAQALLEQSGKLFEQIGDLRSKADVLNARGGFTIMDGKYSEAIAFLLQGMTLGYELGNKKYVAESIGIIGFAVGLGKEPDLEQACLEGAYLMGTADRLLVAMGVDSWLKRQPFVQSMLEWMSLQVGKERWESSWNAGKALTLEQAMELAYQQAPD